MTTPTSDSFEPNHHTAAVEGRGCFGVPSSNRTRHVTQLCFRCIGEIYGEAPLQLHSEKKTFPLCAQRAAFTRRCFFFLSFLFAFYVPLPNCDFFLHQSQFFSLNQFADLFIENLTLSVSTHSHTRMYAVATRRKNTHRERKNDSDRKSKTVVQKIADGLPRTD